MNEEVAVSRGLLVLLPTWTQQHSPERAGTSAGFLHCTVSHKAAFPLIPAKLHF